MLNDIRDWVAFVLSAVHLILFLTEWAKEVSPAHASRSSATGRSNCGAWSGRLTTAKTIISLDPLH